MDLEQLGQIDPAALSFTLAYGLVCVYGLLIGVGCLFKALYDIFKNRKNSPRA